MSLQHAARTVAATFVRRAGPAVVSPKPPGYTGTPRFGLLDSEALTDNQAAFYSHGLSGVRQEVNYQVSAALGLSIAGLMLVTLLVRWSVLSHAYMRFLVTHGDKGAQRFWSYNRGQTWPSIKRNLLYAPIGKIRHNNEVQLSSAITIGTLPTRWHTLLLGVYLITNIVYLMIISYGAPAVQLLAEVRGRAGELAIINMVPTMLFALRNNPLIPILRVSYDTFNLFHRWAARLFMIMSVIHTVVFLINVNTAGGAALIGTVLQASTSYRWGMIATVALTVIVILATSPLRHAFYETFLVLHRILIMITLIGVYIHVEQSFLPQMPYVRAVFGMWGGEWAVRCYLLIKHNISFRGMTKVTIEALPAEACRVTFQLVRPWKFVPGCHAHIYIPSISWFHSHPFTIAWADTVSKVPLTDGDVEKMPYGGASDLPPRASTVKTPTDRTVIRPLDLRAIPSKNLTTSVSFVCRARTGFTRAIYDKASAAPNKILQLRGGIEGPYGGHEPLSSYGTVILFAGGVGITHGTSYLKQLLTDYAEGSVSTRKILLVWSVPNTEALEWVRPWMDQVLRMEGRKDILRIQLFITKPRHQGEIRSNTGTVQMFPGRCNPTTVIEKEMQDRVGAMAVTVCGPGAFSDGVRAAARTHVESGNLDFIEEAFTY